MPQRDVVRSESRPTSGFAMRAKIAPTPITSPRLPSVFTGSMCWTLNAIDTMTGVSRAR